MASSQTRTRCLACGTQPVSQGSQPQATSLTSPLSAFLGSLPSALQVQFLVLCVDSTAEAGGQSGLGFLIAVLGMTSPDPQGAVRSQSCWLGGSCGSRQAGQGVSSGGRADLSSSPASTITI